MTPIFPNRRRPRRLPDPLLTTVLFLGFVIAAIVLIVREDRAWALVVACLVLLVSVGGMLIGLGALLADTGDAAPAGDGADPAAIPGHDHPAAGDDRSPRGDRRSRHADPDVPRVPPRAVRDDAIRHSGALRRV